ncbi:hypothetical protein PHYBOEH_011474 [Phytophthora boehmeriae]|uniref:M96 mating-specific protein family n=1 Tax=Phytophthora boehmeriae TaxID=109152 RepID=A0A8T1VLX8_9STRA|nr:hypothetical protein PHYBOEH_011474 [Phytophthora boehmeriae]
MSFTPVTDDKMVTQDEALEVLGDCDGNHEEPFPLNDIDELLSSMVGELKGTKRTRHESTSPPQKQKRTKSPANSSTASQRRRKAELQSLREQATELEAYLAWLQQHQRQERSKGAASQDITRLLEYDHAIELFRTRRQKENINRKLKKIVDDQTKIFNAMRGILHRRSTTHGMHFVQESASFYFHNSILRADNAAAVNAELTAKVEDFYRQKRFTPPEQPIINITIEPKYDEQRKCNLVELVTTTPLECSAPKVADGILSTFERNGSRRVENNALRMKSEREIQHRDGSFHIDILLFVRKFMENDRAIIIWSDMLLLPSKALRYRTMGYTIVSPSETDPSNACVVHTVAKFFSDPVQDGEGPNSADSKRVEETVLGAMTRTLRKFHHDEQNRLVESALE